jgi:hypothetical protein
VAELVRLDLLAPTASWRRIGVEPTDGCVAFGSVSVHLTEPSSDERGLTGWTFRSDSDGPPTIDGIPTAYVRTAATPLGDGFDHVVVLTDSLERTCAAITDATGQPCKRVRETDQVRQGFHREGEAVIEVVEPRRGAPREPFLWGFVWIDGDMHATCERLGPDLIHVPRPAVQQGRWIAGFRPAADLGAPLAIITPHHRG